MQVMPTLVRPQTFKNKQLLPNRKHHTPPVHLPQYVRFYATSVKSTPSSANETGKDVA